MTDLSDVYEGGRTVVDPQQRLLGMAVFAVGAVLVVGAIPIATTDLSSWLGLDLYEARQAAGVLAGLGVPAVFVGIFVVLPASDTTRAAAAIGASLTVFGVALFSYAYPDQWLSNDPQFALGTIALYLAGTLVTFWCLFVAVATFKTRDDPGGTARVEITEEGKVRVIRPTESGTPGIPGFGSVGLFGNDPDGAVPTQTNDGSQAAPAATDDSVVMAEPTSDGGAATTGDPAIEDDVLESAKTRRRPDTYCGNCDHFRYVSVDDEYVPYCGLHEDVMDDMDACSEWTSNN
ncbi:hypothetical protein SAMN05216226_10521 [Halovenus aranensis]|jgi:hypothetical protein|uniref:Uncharacterized protein n=1 Tax=Halovenus aranensis TaxID=890420 RepID=A0A1G8UMV1_9EURY|nr:hypothetical protein [Halovenus aranensis]SDJ55236.1 hypothetical protein SAMN05216226_10521 [Halovenus aranensis]